jgi:hypothetical protein
MLKQRLSLAFRIESKIRERSNMTAFPANPDKPLGGIGEILIGIHLKNLALWMWLSDEARRALMICCHAMPTFIYVI